jgi:hypothetical protein
MNSLEAIYHNLERSSARFRIGLTVATLGILLFLSSCGPTEANNNPLSGSDVIHAQGAESWDGTNFHYGANSGQFDVRPSPLGIFESSLVKPSTLCDTELAQSQIELCASLESLADVMGMSDTERADLRGRYFIVDDQTMQSLNPSNATGYAIPEFQGGRIVGKGFVVFPEYVTHELSAIAHEHEHQIKNEGLHNLNKTNTSNRLTLGAENVAEDLKCAQIVDETATVCTEVEPGRASCASNSLTELRADTFATIITSRAAGCTAENWDAARCGPGEYSGYLYETDDGPGVLTRAETADLMMTMRRYFLANPAEFDAWVQRERNGQFTDNWQSLITAFGLNELPPEQAINQLMFLDASIQFYAGTVGNSITYSDQSSIQSFCQP